MGKFTRWLVGPSEAEILADMKAAEIQAAAAVIPPTPGVGAPGYGWGTGGTRLAPASMTFAPPLAQWSRYGAMQIPTVARSRNLICTAVGALPLMLMRVDPNDPEADPMRLPPAAWMRRPDPNKTLSWLLSWTTDDLIFQGRAYWLVTNRYAYPNDYPSAFVRMPAEQVAVYPEGRVTWNGDDVPARNVIEFLSPIESVLWTGLSALETTWRLEAAAQRFASNNVPSGWLKQTGGETMSGDDLVALAAAWDAQRAINATGALNDVVDYHESTLDPERLQLTQAREHQALELSRVMNVPPYQVGAPQGTRMTYTNAQSAKEDLLDFGALPYITCIEDVLSGPNVTPLGQIVRLDVNNWLRDPLTPDVNATPTNPQQPTNVTNVRPFPTNVNDGRPRNTDGQNVSTGSY